MLSATGPLRASERDKELNLYLWAFLVVTNIVDVLASRRAFELGMTELNLVVDLILADYGILGVALFKSFWLVGLMFLLPYIRGWTQLLLGLVCLAYFALTVVHTWMLSPLL
jgi:hypothetical protein